MFPTSPNVAPFLLVERQQLSQPSVMISLGGTTLYVDVDLVCSWQKVNSESSSGTTLDQAPIVVVLSDVFSI